MPSVRRIELDRPWAWLAKGWQDLARNPVIGASYGILAALTGYLITLGLWQLGWFYLVLPLIAGFLIVGPILTVGLYEVSRRQEAGISSSLADAVAAFGRNRSQIALLGVALLVLMIAWARIAALLFMLYFGYTPPSLEHLFAQTFLEPAALPFLVIGLLVGGFLAFVAFTISVVSIPLLLDRPDANVIDAIATSVRAVQLNLGPMLLWAALILVFTLFGLVTLYLGLVVTLPLVAHASWHCYRDVVTYGQS
jgi:uncharacterized membrane protein